MQRRRFMKSVAAAAASCWAAPLRAGAGARWDLAVVGAGTAGVPAALFAARRGASVLLVDAAQDIGGTLHLAAGQISAAGTTLQTRLGIIDSADVHFEDVMRLSRGLADRQLVRLAVDEAGTTVDWLLARGLTPLPDHPVSGDSPGRPGYSVPRYLWGANEGRDILAVLRRELAPEVSSGRIALQLGTRVTGLLSTDDGRIEGLRATTPDGPRTWRARHVLLTSGGYAMNPALFEQLVGHPAYTAESYPHSMGDGLKLATSVGGWLRGQQLHRPGTGSILTADRFGARVYARFTTLPSRRQPWEIWVDVDGRRFIREDEPEDNVRARAVARLARLKYAIVFDRRVLEQAPVAVPGWSREKLLAHFDEHPMFESAGSPEALAGKLGIDPAGLAATLAQYNAAVASGSDPLGRQHMPQLLDTPPYYGIVHLGSSATSSTGVAVDGKLRVLRGDGVPVAGLYAAGEVLGSGVMVGDAFVPGMLITPALSFGRLLGQTLPLR